jgi:D-alanine-D-alanine ligase
VSRPRVRVAVLMGGRSSEHEISIESARSVIEGLDPERFETVIVEIARDGTWALGSGAPPAALDAARSARPRSGPAEGVRANREVAPGEAKPDASQGHERVTSLPVRAASGSVTRTLAEVDVAFPVLHGPFGEDGTVQGLLELANVPYVGAGVAASAVCMDKDLFKDVMRANDIPVTRSVALRDGDLPQNPFGYPVFVKPARLGSSVGITKAHDEAELAEAVELAFRHDDKVLVEEFVEGIEVEVGVLGTRGELVVSLPGEIVVREGEWYDYHAKYDEGGMDLNMDPAISEEQVARVQELAHRAFVATECDGMVRADCFVRASDGEVLVNELNTIPGFTATSVYAKLFEATGIPYAQQLERLIELALRRHERRSKLRY